MTVINLDECRKINEIVDFIVTHHNISVEKVKEKFGLSKDEYDMISELMMPSIRWYNKAKRLESGIRALMHKLIDDEAEAEKEELIRKCRVLKAQGYTNATIGKKLGISDVSVKLYTMEEPNETDDKNANSRAS